MAKKRIVRVKVSVWKRSPYRQGPYGLRVLELSHISGPHPYREGEHTPWGVVLYFEQEDGSFVRQRLSRDYRSSAVREAGPLEVGACITRLQLVLGDEYLVKKVRSVPYKWPRDEETRKPNEIPRFEDLPETF